MQTHNVEHQQMFLFEMRKKKWVTTTKQWNYDWIESNSICWSFFIFISYFFLPLLCMISNSYKCCIRWHTEMDFSFPLSRKCFLMKNFFHKNVIIFFYWTAENLEFQDNFFSSIVVNRIIFLSRFFWKSTKCQP